MLASWGIIYGLAVFCFTMLFTNPPNDRVEEKDERDQEEGSWGREEIT